LTQNENTGKRKCIKLQNYELKANHLLFLFLKTNSYSSVKVKLSFVEHGLDQWISSTENIIDDSSNM